ncbi:hypothetical protein CHCC15290_0505 [Bacillus licheniformis]|nr:hypothetical protein MUY_003176 [Bacillus licheniformis WX-02]TWK57229.1 hypothetical protein CHCC20343_4333 [Bacillus licheniformis]TWK68326.1 hypothetical protein CHCC20342_2870 [Bacillus licheniformis]TWL64878.1 hypothetical protein CHCC15322_3071 [Bacillus licheniformis]TWL92867.1 hypothetical protein CHCC15290_0505 [Bacillus licheniformis]
MYIHMRVNCSFSPCFSVWAPAAAGLPESFYILLEEQKKKAGARPFFNYLFNCALAASAS